MQKIQMTFAYELLPSCDLSAEVAVVVDSLRATTTIVHALASGASDVLFFEQIEEAKAAAAALGKGKSVLAGERGGLPIEGFDIGNSPAECRPEIVNGKTLILTTTNGTRAIKRALPAKRILIGSMANAKAVADMLRVSDDDVHFLAAGSNNSWAADDVFCIGYIIENILTKKDAFLEDSAHVAHTYFNANEGNSLEVFRRSRSGRALLKIGYDADIALSVKADIFDFVPVVDREMLKITKGSG